MQKQNITYSYNDSGYTRCDIIYKNKTFTGHAYCLDVDKDFQSEKTGCFIAERKAFIKKLKFIKSELAAALSVLENFEKTLESCKEYNAKNFEAKRLRKEIYLKRKELKEIETAIKDEQDYLTYYIQNKDKFYQRQRVRRGQDK